MIDTLTILLVSLSGLVMGGLLGLYFGTARERKSAHWREERNAKAAENTLRRFKELEQEYGGNLAELWGRVDGAICGLLMQIGRSDVADEYERIKMKG